MPFLFTTILIPILCVVTCSRNIRTIYFIKVSDFLYLKLRCSEYPDNESKPGTRYHIQYLTNTRYP